jgi:hypothetical protein
MVATKPIAQVVQKWSDSTGRVPTAYTAGINGASWQAAAVAGQALYVQALQDPKILNRRVLGINQVTDATWKQDAVTKGSARIAAGMQAAVPKFQTKMAKNLSVIQGVNIAPRTTDPMQNIDGRVKPIAAALHAMRLAD